MALLLCNVYACVAGNNFIIVFTISAYIASEGLLKIPAAVYTEQKVVDLGVSVNRGSCCSLVINGAYSRSR